MSDSKQITVNEEKVRKAIESQIPLLITTFTLPHEMEMYITQVVTCFLKQLGQENMIEYVVYCVNELTTNAKKANTKRVYFKERNLDITDEAQYSEGMKTFKKDTLENINHYLMLQKQQGLFVKLLLQTRNDKMRIEIRNNVPLTVFEYKRIHDKLARAQQYGSIEDAFAQILDDTEGAGLGLIIMVLMLRKIGLSEENFQFLSENGETITRIILDLNPESQKQVNIISKDIVDNIDDLPHFPDNIAKINTLLNDNKTKLSEIATQISNDVTLTADLLKLVNSAAFSLAAPCQSILKAVQLVGTRGIKNLLYSLGSLKSLNNGEKENNAIWAHCYKVAFFSYNLARNFCSKNKDVIEDSYVCGLLHDMGKVVFQNVHPDLLNKFRTLCTNKDIPTTVVEKLSSGVNHAEIGALIAEKWNFPDVIIQTIRYHHDPANKDNQYQMITEIVYLANMIAQYSNGDVDIYQIDNSILTKYHLETKERLDDITAKMEQAFVKQNQN